MVVSILLIKLIADKNYLGYIVVGIASAGFSAFLATKLSILSVLLVFVTFPFLSVLDNKIIQLRMSRKKVRFAALVSILFPGIVFLSIYILLYKVNLLDRFMHFYASADLVTVLLSGRNILATEAINAYIYDYSTVAMLFGSGEFWFGMESASKLVEIDPIDILMTYGLFGVLIVYGFFLVVVINCLHHMNTNPFSKFVAFTIILLIGISFTAGHVVYSGLGAYLIAALFALGSVEYRPAESLNRRGDP